MDQVTKVGCASESFAQSDDFGQKQRYRSLFSTPRLFVGLSPKGLLDSDSVRSPTSPLDSPVFENLRNSIRSPRSPHHGQQKSWVSSKLGLSIVDSLDDDDTKLSGKVIRSSESKRILFGGKASHFETHIDSFEVAKSLPRNFAVLPHSTTKSFTEKGNSAVLFEIGDSPFEPDPFGKYRSYSFELSRSIVEPSNPKSKSGSENVTTLLKSPLKMSAGDSILNNFPPSNLSLSSMSAGSCDVVSVLASDIKLSEDYTCVISHGPNPKKTHIFGDRILECHNNDLAIFGESVEVKTIFGESVEVKTALYVTNNSIKAPTPSDFLSLCFSCSKKLEDGKDIYIYRGEKAFCSLACRSEEIMMDEALEKNTSESCEDSSKSDDIGKLFSCESSDGSPKSDDDDDDHEFFNGTGFFIDP